jgi:hypothetical protein
MLTCKSEFWGILTNYPKNPPGIEALNLASELYYSYCNLSQSPTNPRPELRILTLELKT